MSRGIHGPPTHFLSHVLGADTPAYGGGEGFQRTPASRIADGESANSEVWRFPNHLGTHLDAPRHFIDGARTTDDYPPAAWWFTAPVIVDVPKGDDGLIVPADVDALVPRDADLVLLRTGYEAYRMEERYWARNPGLTQALGEWFRRERPSVRAVGIDVISVTARAHRMEGRLAHRAFLDPEEAGSPVLLLEDVALHRVTGQLKGVCVAPLRVQSGDGGPCTILGWI
jgi:arylformamidase